MRTVLLCHHDDDLNRVALPRWLASFSDVAGIVQIEEKQEQKKARIRREIKRVGWARFADVLAFRLYHRVFVQRKDSAYEKALLERLFQKYPAIPSDTPIHTTASPNSPDTREFLERIAPDVMIARCKVILKPEIFGAAKTGTYVMHPGICPEYRNAHGCFWALASDDLDKVGMTLLKVDKGIDTGPVYGFYSYPYDELSESHITIQHRTVFDNLDALQKKLLEIHAGGAPTIDTRGRKSTNWGQPWLTRQLKWKRAARVRDRAQLARPQVSLLYHDVTDSGESGFPGADADVYKLPVDTFAAHLDRIAELEQGRVQLLTRPSIPRTASGAPPVLFSFDDGGASALEPTATLLEKHGFRGHFFIVTDRIGEPGFLRAADIVELHRRGHHIGSHSRSHPAAFSQLSYEEMVAEWRDSREALRAILGEDVWTASVPGGYYSRKVARAAREAGYRLLYNSEPTARVGRVGSLLVLGRYGIQRHTPAEEALKIARADLLPRLRQSLKWNAKKPLKKLGGSAWLAFRRWFFERKAAGTTGGNER